MNYTEWFWHAYLGMDAVSPPERLYRPCLEGKGDLYSPSSRLSFAGDALLALLAMPC